MSDRAVDQCSSASTVEGTRCSRLCHLKLSIHNYMDCHQFYPSLHLFPAFTPSAVSFFHLTGQLLALYHLNVSLCCMLQTIFGNHKWPSQPRGAFVDSFPVCINIYQARKQRQMSTMRKCLLVTRLWAHPGSKCNPSIRFVVLKHCCTVSRVGGSPLAPAELEISLIANIHTNSNWKGHHFNTLCTFCASAEYKVKNWVIRGLFTVTVCVSVHWIQYSTQYHLDIKKEKHVVCG